MSEQEITPLVPPEPPPLPRRSRLRRFFLRHLPFTLAGLAVLLVLLTIGAYFFLSSIRFENIVRGRLAASIENLTGGRVEIGSFHWHLLNLQADVDGLVVHGLEAPGEAPYARIDHLRIRGSLLGFINPRILLRDLEITRPSFTSSFIPAARLTSPIRAGRGNPASPSSINSSTLRPATSPSSKASSITTTAPQPSTFRTASCPSILRPATFRCS